MSIAIAILANKNLERTKQLAQFISTAGINVCIHIDATVSARKFAGIHAALSTVNNIHFTKRIECSWGEFSLVEAELQLASEIIEKWPDTSHVQLISGDTLPIRPLHELVSFLKSNPNTDFIESAVVGENNWIVDGLEAERFTFSFPFSWTKQRRLFDLAVSIQRKFGIKRKMPQGLTPHIGSQWWCLSRKTIDAILNDPQKKQYDAFFKNCWIPDESYFQTLVRKHSDHIQAHSLLFSQFDFQGKPTVFYDDHLGTLSGVTEYFIRKVWQGADGLYQHYQSKWCT